MISNGCNDNTIVVIVSTRQQLHVDAFRCGDTENETPTNIRRLRPNTTNPGRRRSPTRELAANLRVVTAWRTATSQAGVIGPLQRRHAYRPCLRPLTTTTPAPVERARCYLFDPPPHLRCAEGLRSASARRRAFLGPGTGRRWAFSTMITPEHPRSSSPGPDGDLKPLKRGGPVACPTVH